MIKLILSHGQTKVLILSYLNCFSLTKCLAFCQISRGRVLPFYNGPSGLNKIVSNNSLKINKKIDP